MVKLFINATAAILLSAMMLSVAPVQAKETNHPGKSPTQLTEQQKKEISALHQEMLEKRKEIIKKYVEFGVIPQEKGDKIIKHLEKRQSKMAQNGFIPKWHKHHHCR
ncbi:uncharacterized protein DUF2680 [Scopulibacillus darangshiensis]|uniref:Uncharacterized protein DUF2680 n=1 Tax=Scopulibacillus darangshiensis TaxID=442528 RepID=A0A4R2P8L1_9BACL|nr:YckD family protein [Scopulibacillus darangshiensis]TCP31303.1 uncharacterized protein DUF2680 [Scopulibacillus darangshiensis]